MRATAAASVYANGPKKLSSTMLLLPEATTDCNSNAASGLLRLLPWKFRTELSSTATPEQLVNELNATVLRVMPRVGEAPLRITAAWLTVFKVMVLLTTTSPT